MNNNDHFDRQTTPFISSDSYVVESETAPLTGAAPSAFLHENDTPFLSAYETEDHEEASDPAEDEITEFIAELYDEELNQALYELANEAAELYETELESEFNSDSDYQRAHLQRQVMEDYTSLFARELDYFFDPLIASSEQIDLSRMSDAEIDAWVDKHLADYETQVEESTEEDELFEGFKRLKKWGRKLRRKAKKTIRKAGRAVKKAAKKVGRGIKKVVKKITKGFLRRVLRKLRKLMLRFLKKVLNSKLVKKHLPPRYRELFILIGQLMNKKRSKKFARRAWRKARGSMRKEVEAFEYYFDEYAHLQHELDIHISNLIHAETEAEEDRVVAAYEQEDQYPDDHTWKALDVARDKFVREINQLREGEDPAPHVEHFVTAILQTLQVVLRPIVIAYGRTKTIEKIIAPLIFKILTRFIKGKNKRPILKSLSRVLGDVSLKVLLKMEVTEEVRHETAADAVASLAEETLNEIVQLPAYVFDDDELAQAYAMETFEQMAGANLPPILPESQYLAHPELRESSVRGAWIAYRSKRRRRIPAKKYSRIFRKKISPYLLKEIATFGETSLAEFLSERMDVPVNQELEANVHLYEAIRETDLYQLSLAEENVPGLNIDSEFGYQLFHPLTPLNAGLLLGEPGLGRRIDPVFMATPTFVRPGQRFFYLEIGHARPKVMIDQTGTAYLRRLSQLHQTFNFVRNEIKIHLFISEQKVQEVAAKLRSGPSYGRALSHLLKIFDGQLKIAASSVMIHKRTQIVHPYITPGPHSGLEFSKLIPEFMQELFLEQLRLWAARAISGFIKHNGRTFIAATEDDYDGVTLTLKIHTPPGFPVLRKILSNHSLLIPHNFPEGNPERVEVTVKPGFYY